MNKQSSTLYTASDADLHTLRDQTVAVIGYGNQGRAQALNLRDSGVRVIVGNRPDGYRAHAQEDGFEVVDIPSAVSRAQVVMLLLPDELTPGLYQEQVKPHLAPGSALVFASGYNVAFDLVDLPPVVDVLLLAPRMIGVGVRERHLTGEGFYCLVGVHQDASGRAKEVLLALTWGIGGLHKPAIEVTFKQEAILDLFNEQAFGPAFGRVLLTAISVLLEAGLPPEAVLAEMYLSEEMAYTYRKMAQVGLVRQTLFHSRTSQYGAMSRGVRFMGLGLKERMRRIYREIDSGEFAREWGNPLARLKLKAIRTFAMRQSINSIEQRVRKTLGLEEVEEVEPASGMEDLLTDPRVQGELDALMRGFEF
jgi:ketol-acid reductoisomerase